MEFQSLGQDPFLQCHVIRLGHVTIMLDCGLDLASLLDMPDENENGGVDDMNSHSKGHAGQVRVRIPSFDAFPVETIDVVLISNHMTMLALPYLTEYTGFSGRIYATHPSYEFGMKHMQEMVMMVQKRNEKATAHTTALPHAADVPADATNLRSLYSLHDVNACMSKVTPVSYDQPIDLQCQALHASAVASGFYIGSANWIIESEYSKIGYISSSSSTTMRHPASISLRALKGCDILIVTDINATSRKSPVTAMTELSKSIQNVLNRGGDALIPSYPCGVVFDIIEFLHKHHALSIYCISPIAEFCLSYSNIAVEWLCESKQEKAYEPRDPFVHQELMRRGQLRTFSSTTDPAFSQAFKSGSQRTPSIFFVSHPSMRFGDVVECMRAWQRHPPNTSLFLIEPGFPIAKVMGPYGDAAVQVHHIPIDLRLTPTQLNKIVADVGPSIVLCPKHIAASLSKQCSVEGTSFSPLERIAIDLQKMCVMNDADKDNAMRTGCDEFVHAKMGQAIASAITLRSCNGFLFEAIDCDLSTLNGRHSINSGKRRKLSPKPKSKEPLTSAKALPPQPVASDEDQPTPAKVPQGVDVPPKAYGSLSLQNLIRSLEKRFLHRYKIDRCSHPNGGDAYTLEVCVATKPAWIIMKGNGDAIHCTDIKASEGHVRQILSEVVLENLVLM